jgi:hypothetical protein
MKYAILLQKMNHKKWLISLEIYISYLTFMQIITMIRVMCYNILNFLLIYLHRECIKNLAMDVFIFLN